MAGCSRYADRRWLVTSLLFLVINVGASALGYLAVENNSDDSFHLCLDSVLHLSRATEVIFAVVAVFSVVVVVLTWLRMKRHVRWLISLNAVLVGVLLLSLVWMGMYNAGHWEGDFRASYEREGTIVNNSTNRELSRFKCCGWDNVLGCPLVNDSHSSDRAEKHFAREDGNGTASPTPSPAWHEQQTCRQTLQDGIEGYVVRVIPCIVVLSLAMLVAVGLVFVAPRGGDPNYPSLLEGGTAAN